MLFKRSYHDPVVRLRQTENPKLPCIACGRRKNCILPWIACGRRKTPDCRGPPAADAKTLYSRGSPAADAELPTPMDRLRQTQTPRNCCCVFSSCNSFRNTFLYMKLPQYINVFKLQRSRTLLVPLSLPAAGAGAPAVRACIC